MTIEEKAKEFACYSSFPDGSTKKEMDNRYDGFKAGAEWMIEKALNWVGDNVVFDKFGRPVDTEVFRKSLEE